MLGSITDSLSSLFSSVVNNLVSQIANLAPDLLTGALSTAANAILPGSGPLVQAFLGPIVESGVQGFTAALRDTVLPSASQAFADAGLTDVDVGNLVNSLSSTFLGGVQRGLSGG